MLRMNRRRNRAGQAALETVLVVVFFLAAIIGTVDFGQLLFTHQSLVERVRGAVRYGVVRPFDEPAIRNMVLYGQAETPAGGSTSSFLGLAPANVRVARNDTGTDDERITVSIVDYHYQFFSPWIAGSFTNNDAVVETMPVEHGRD